MNILVAPDSWGGFRSAVEMAAAIQRALPEHDCRLRPMSDGGEGATEVLRPYATGRRHVASVDAWGQPVEVEVLELGARHFVETAQVLGLHRGPGHPSDGHSGGLAPLLQPGIVLGLGGSGTIDGGWGLAVALGLTSDPTPLVGALRGAAPTLIGEIWVDVQASFLEAVPRFGPQKGLPPEELSHWDDRLQGWAGRLNDWRSARGAAPIPLDLPGGGAAGGLGFGLAALLDLPLIPGVEAIASVVGLPSAMAGADVVITGEGRLDGSSFGGKVVGHVQQRAARAGLPVIIFCGAVSPGLGPVDGVVVHTGEGSSFQARLDHGLASLPAVVESVKARGSRSPA